MKKLIFIFVCLMCGLGGQAQQVPLSSQYMMNRLVMNPAYAGELGFYSASLSYRKQWVGIEGAPTTQNISIHGPAMKGKLGLGLLFIRDAIGVSKENNISASFAYRITGKNKNTLSFGLSGSTVFTTNQWSQVTTTDANDIAFSSDSPLYIFPDFSAGAFYRAEDYYFGFSVPMFLQHQLSGNAKSYTIKNDFKQYNYLFEAGYQYSVNKVLFKPSVLWRYLPSAAQQFDLNMIVDFDNIVAVGLSYRTQDAIAVMMQFHVNDQIIMGYSYDHTTSMLQQFNNGTHELFLRYDFRYKVKAIDPRFF